MRRQIKGNLPLCQGEFCKSNFSGKTLAVKVCYQCDCESSNTTTLPVLLCLECDQAIHAGKYKNHERSPVKGKDSFKKMSNSKIAESDSGAEDDQEPIVPHYPEKVKSKTVNTRRKFMKVPADNSKKKPRRHNTDDPGRDFIRLKVYVGESGDFNLELIPALKGKNLKESLDPILEKYNITFESHSVFLDSSNTPLPLAFETFPLSGSILHVRDNSRVNVDQRVRDISKNFESKPEHPVSRTPSFGKRNQKEEKETITKEDEEEQDDVVKKGKKGVPSPLEAEDRSQSIQSGSGTVKDTSKGKPASILTGLFAANPAVLMKGKEVPAVRSLPEILQYFTVHGLESESKPSGSDEQEFYLEESWTKVVDSSEKLDKKERDQQEAIWELLATEVAYINKLQVIKKIFILCLRNIQSEGYLQDLDLRCLFSNIDSIYAVNVDFWLRSLKSVVNMARHTKKLLDPFYMADGFSSFDSLFEPYVQYCMEDACCLKFLKKKQAEDEHFKLYVEWCESRSECKRLKLNDLLVKPMQRVTKYPLLLKAILKKTVKEDKRTELIAMIETVEKFVGKVNASMKIRHEKEKLSRTAVKIEYCWPVDPVTDEVEKCLIDNYCDFDLCRTMPGANREQHRCLLYEGALRLTEKQGRMDIYAFLFTDMLLLTKAKKMDKFKVVKVPMRVDKIKVHDLKDPGNFLLVYLNEYRTVVQAYVFQASQNVKEKWVQMINKAKNLYRAVLQSDGTKCLTADDADEQSPATTPDGSPTLDRKHATGKGDVDSPDGPMVTITPAASPKLHRHLSGSDGNLSLLGHHDHPSSAIIRRASCNERKTKPKRESQHRRPRADSKVTRSTSDPHNKPLHHELGGLNRSSSAPKSPKPIPEKDLPLLTESSVDPESPRSTTSISEVDLTVGVDVDEIQMSLSPDTETSDASSATDVATSVGSPSEGTRPALEGGRKDQQNRESSEKLKLLLAQKLSNAKRDSGKDGESEDNSMEGKRRGRHADRKKTSRSSSVDRARRSGEHKSAATSGSSNDSATSPVEANGRKSKLTRVPSSGSRQLPDPNQISAKTARSLPKAQTADAEEDRTSGKISDMIGSLSSSPGARSDAGLQVLQDLSDSLEMVRSQAPRIKEPLMLPISRNNSNGSDRKRAGQLPRRSPLLLRKSAKDNAVRQSMDEQLLGSKPSPPTPRRAKSEADTPVESLRTKFRTTDSTTSDEACKTSENVRCRTSGGIPKNSESSFANCEETQSRNSESNSKNSQRHSRNLEEHAKHANGHSRSAEARSANSGTLSKNLETNSKNSETLSNNSETRSKNPRENPVNSETRTKIPKSPSMNSERTHARSSEGTQSRPKSDERERARPRPKDLPLGEVGTSDTKRVASSAAQGSNTTSGNSQATQEHVSAKSGDKPRRQIKKYRGRDVKKIGEAEGRKSNVENGCLTNGAEPIMLESSEYV